MGKCARRRLRSVVLKPECRLKKQLYRHPILISRAGRLRRATVSECCLDMPVKEAEALPPDTNSP